MKAQILVVVAFSALIMSCGGSDFSESTTDQPDVTTDSGLPDSNEEADTNGPDTTTDAGPDTTVDASPDVVNDAAPDTTTPVDSGTPCTAGAVDCQGKTPRSCDQNGVWQTKADCQFLCVNAVCKGNCNPGTKQCKDTELQFCDANGEWQHSESCAMSCDKNANPPACIGHWCCNTKTGGGSDLYTEACNCSAKVESCTTGTTPSCTNSYNCCFTDNYGTGRACRCFSVKSQDACVQLMDDAKKFGTGSAVVVSVDSCPVQ